MVPSHCWGFWVMTRISDVPPTERSFLGIFDSSEQEAIMATSRRAAANFRQFFMVFCFWVQTSACESCYFLIFSF